MTEIRQGAAGPFATVGAVGPTGPAGPTGPTGPAGGGSISPANYAFEDDFDYVGLATGTAVNTTGVNLPTGKGNWFVNASTLSGSIVLTGSSAEHPGVLILRAADPAASGSGMTIRRGTAASAAQTFLAATKIEQQTWIASVSNVTVVRTLLGFSDGATSSIPVNALGFRQNAAVLGNSNWWCSCRAGSVETVLDSGVLAVASQFYNLTVKQAVLGTITFEIDGVQVKSINTNVPTALLNDLAFCLPTASGGSGTVDLALDYHGFQSKTLTR